MAKELTPQEEGQLLSALLGNRSRQAFADEFGVPGGASMISQNTSGHRRISLNGALAYSKGLGVPISAFSPRIAAQLQKANMLPPAESPTEPASENTALISGLAVGTTFKHAPVVAWACLGDDLRKPNENWPAEAMRVINATVPTSALVKWIEVQDDLLAPRVLKGDFVAVDPNGTPRMDSLVLAIAADGTYMLRFWRPLADGAFEVFDGAGRTMDSVRHGIKVEAVFVTLQRDSV
ncbi:hypothetical protein [Aquabacterium sp.]|uniref:hypothetical protein n=1 Tax=Aquabacterium sp. TaxID=1872578 RepID=UPI0035AECBA7